MFLLYGRRIVAHSVDPSLSHFLGEFPGLGLALVPDGVVSEANFALTVTKFVFSNSGNFGAKVNLPKP